MDSVSVIHESPTNLGGAESIFMHTLEALQDKYDVTAITAKNFNIELLNEYYNTNVDKITVTKPSLPLITWGEKYEYADNLLSRGAGRLDPYILRFFKWAAARETDSDLVIHTLAESKHGDPSIQYIHHPWFRRYSSAAYDSYDNKILAVLENLLSPIQDYDDFPTNSTILTNSHWTANDLESVYGVEAIVCPPPVKTMDIPEPAEDRQIENTVIMLGRIVSYKRQHLGVDIVKMARARGGDFSLTIAGPIYEKSYAKRIKKLESKYDWITFRGCVSRDELVNLLHTHEFGLHCYPYEHFGIAVAEMVAAGVLPIIPDSGGQVEIINSMKELLWKTPTEAADLLYEFSNNRSLRKSIETQLPNIRQKYSAVRFKEEMRKHVENYL